MSAAPRMSTAEATALIRDRLADRRLLRALFADTPLGGLSPEVVYTSGGCLLFAAAVAEWTFLPAVEVVGGDEVLHVALRLGSGELFDADGRWTTEALRAHWAEITDLPVSAVRCYPLAPGELRARALRDANGGAERLALIISAVADQMSPELIAALR